jgi:hypothetical protein
MHTKFVTLHRVDDGAFPYLCVKDSLFYDLEADRLMYCLGAGVDFQFV